jgi:hypothetical protein
MLPSPEGRFVLRLRDKEGKFVARTEPMHKSQKALPDDLNIHHLGTNELGYIAGIIPLTTNMAIQLASVNLDQHFRIPPPGDYRLEVEERLFQIQADGHLAPISFPPVVANLKVIDQPSEMTFYLRDLARQRKLFWGPSLGLLRIGVAYGLGRSASGKGIDLEVFLENLGTNDVRNLRLPSLEEQFDVSLLDAAGTQVPKTALGKQRGLPLTIGQAGSGHGEGLGEAIGNALGFGNPRRSRNYRPVFLSARDATPIHRVNLNELFEIKSPGQCRLTYQQRLYQLNSTNKLAGLTMPMVVVPIDVP